MCQSYESRPTTNQNLVEVEKQVQQSREKNYVSDDPEQLTSGGGETRQENVRLLQVAIHEFINKLSVLKHSSLWPSIALSLHVTPKINA